MTKKKSRFRFKQFEMDHFSSSMRIGVDAVLLGAWAGAEGFRPSPGSRMLDVGCGCGVIALMLAQRFGDCFVDAVDIHHESVAEAEGNFLNSPWRERLAVTEGSFPSAIPSGTGYSLIVSNPPYFDSGIQNPDTPRLVARHQGVLSPFSLLTDGKRFLEPGGRIAMILPVQFGRGVEEAGISAGLSLTRSCLVRGLPHLAPKRILMEFTAATTVSGPQCSELTLEKSPGVPTPEYRSLCAPFYLRF